ncbi:hypothetical protein, partial [Thalassospira sp. UBA848]|uniref:hypothetical protein n=1 Tax=Thalassospira sp. UBA848 TaxID=1947677 RepID=UPI0025D733C9
CSEGLVNGLGPDSKTILFIETIRMAVQVPRQKQCRKCFNELLASRVQNQCCMGEVHAGFCWNIPRQYSMVSDNGI